MNTPAFHLGTNWTFSELVCLSLETFFPVVPSEKSEDELESLANVQLPVVGVSSPSSAVWKSPKSPKLSNDESSISSENEDEKLNGSEPFEMG